MDGRCDAPIAAGLRDAPVVESGLSQASSGQVRLCSALDFGARLSHRDRSRRYWASFSYIASRSMPVLVDFLRWFAQLIILITTVAFLYLRRCYRRFLVDLIVRLGMFMAACSACRLR